MKFWTKVVLTLLILVALFYVLSTRTIPTEVTYGVSFSKLHADELNLDWKATYRALLEDLGVQHLRLSATWPMIEPREGEFDFSALDYQMRLAETHGADVVLAVGRKTPGWPECHFPDWTTELDLEKEHSARLTYMKAVVERYKTSPALRYWQVENEPFLNFATERCGIVDEKFFAEEIALVRTLDPQHKVIVTDGGEFGVWRKAHRYGDVFGSTMYLYVWTKHIGYWRYPIGAGFFTFKQNIIDWMFGSKPMVLIELGLEPCLHKPIVDTSLDEQLQHMDMGRFEEIIGFAKQSGFSEQYLWGGEWWYYMKEKGHPEFWERAKSMFEENKAQ